MGRIVVGGIGPGATFAGTGHPMKVGTQLKKLYEQIVHSHSTPAEVAEGLALGVFIGFTPTLGFHTFMALGLAIVLGKHKLATVIGTWITNPLTALPLYYFCYRVGVFITGYKLHRFGGKELSQLFHLGVNLLYPLWVGCLWVGLLGAFVTYFVGRPALKRLFARVRHKKAHDHR